MQCDWIEQTLLRSTALLHPIHDCPREAQNLKGDIRKCFILIIRYQSFYWDTTLQPKLVSELPVTPITDFGNREFGDILRILNF